MQRPVVHIHLTHSRSSRVKVNGMERIKERIVGAEF